MTDQYRLTDQGLPGCPDCDANLTLVSTWPSPGLWGYHQVQVYECPTHGPIFVSPDAVVEQGAWWGRPYVPPPDDGDRDARVPATRKPVPVLDADAIALPEPEPDAQ